MLKGTALEETATPTRPMSRALASGTGGKDLWFYLGHSLGLLLSCGVLGRIGGLGHLPATEATVA